MTRTTALGVVMLCAYGCSGHPATPATPSPSPSEPPPRICRTYATAIRLVEHLGSTARTTDLTCVTATPAGLLNYACQGGGAHVGGAYASQSDFVDEAQTFGRVLVLRSLIQAPMGFNNLRNNSFDAQKRLIGSEVPAPLPGLTPAETVAFNQWDSKGRPTSGSYKVSGPLDCAGSVTVAYDEGTRTVTMKHSPSNIVGCVANVVTWMYDENAMLVRYTDWFNDFSFDVLGTARMCKPPEDGNQPLGTFSTGRISTARR